MSVESLTANTGSEAETLAVHALAARGLSTDLAPTLLDGFQQRFNEIPAMIHMGCVLDTSAPPIVRVALPEVQVHHQGGMGTEAVNGAVLSGLGDCALGVAGVLQFGGQRAGTVEMSIKFLRPTVGRSVTAYAVALKRGGNVVFAEAELYCAGQLCALASGTVSQPSGATDQRF
ncbi:MAG: PaaI family thioesterase [Pseudomonadota bacterium]